MNLLSYTVLSYMLAKEHYKEIATMLIAYKLTWHDNVLFDVSS